MFFSSSNINRIVLNQYIVGIFKLPNNDNDHLIGVSDESELIEFNKSIISTCLLERPKDDFLKSNGHVCNKSVKAIQLACS